MTLRKRLLQMAMAGAVVLTGVGVVPTTASATGQTPCSRAEPVGVPFACLPKQGLDRKTWMETSAALDKGFIEGSSWMGSNHRILGANLCATVTFYTANNIPKGHTTHCWWTKPGKERNETFRYEVDKTYVNEIAWLEISHHRN